jgi:shikimate kinase
MKILLLGTTCSGKSTIAETLANFYNLTLIEVDEEVLKLNNGIWPKGERVSDKYFEQINKAVLNQENILYITSWLEKDEIIKFNKAGFFIIEMHTTLEILLERKQKRDNLTDAKKKRVIKNFKEYLKIIEDKEVQQVLNISLDTSKKEPKEVVKSIQQKITKHNDKPNHNFWIIYIYNLWNYFFKTKDI